MKKLLPKFAKNPKGFTLVELLVVVSIIAVLSVIGITIFTGVQKGARDAKRKGDMDAYAKAYEASYVNTSTHYRVLTGSDFAGNAVPTADMATYPYSGILAAGADAYIICAKLENNNGNASDASGTSASGAAATYYCLKNQQ